MIFLLYPRLLVQIFHNFPALTPADPAIALLEDQIRGYLGTGNFFPEIQPSETTGASMLEMRGVKLIVLPPSHISESHLEGESQAAIPPLLLPMDIR
jgi:hypothetical protein